MDKDKAIQTLEKFLKAWMQRNFLKMFKHSQITWKGGHSEKDLGHLYNSRKLSRFQLKAMAESGSAALRVKIEMVVNDMPVEKEVMVICETGVMAPSIDGVWGVNPISVL